MKSPAEPTPYPPELSLAANKLERRFGDTMVLCDVTFSHKGAGVVALFGGNGSGKTTLLRMIGQLLRPTSGTLSLCGVTVDGNGDSAARRMVGYAADVPIAYAELSVLENLRYAARLAGLSRPDGKARAAALVESWSLTDFASSPIRVLSRGWQRRYSFARAEIARPPVLLLDEPTNGLDETARAAFDAALAQWTRDKIVVIATHERDAFADSETVIHFESSHA